MIKTREFHDNESENISDESIGDAALINFFVPDAALIRLNRGLALELGLKKKLRGSGKWSIKLYPRLFVIYLIWKYTLQ